jgi:hypothetical protein
LIKFWVGACQINDAFNDTDDVHDGSACAAGEQGDQQHRDAGAGGANDEFVNPQRAQNNSENSGGDFCSADIVGGRREGGGRVCSHRLDRRGRGKERNQIPNSVGSLPPGHAFHPDESIALKTLGEEVLPGKRAALLVSDCDVVVHGLILAPQTLAVHCGGNA